MKTIETAADLDPWLVQLAFANPSEAPFVSSFRNRGDRELRLEACADDRNILDALGMIRRFSDDALPGDAQAVACFARAGRHPMFVAIPLPVAVHRSETIGRMPHLYPLLRLQRAYPRYVAAASDGRRLRLIGVEFGRPILDLRTPAEVGAQIQLLEHYRTRHQFDHVVLYGQAGQRAALRDAMTDPIVVDGDLHDSSAAIVGRVNGIVHEEDRRDALHAIRRAASCEPWSVASGPLETLRAVEERRALALILTDEPGSRCSVCHEDEPCRECTERQSWAAGVREVLALTAVRSRIPLHVIAESVPDLDPFACLLADRPRTQNAATPAEEAEWCTLGVCDPSYSY